MCFFFVHKYHSGVIIILGAGTLLARSTKQKLNSKSSTEAEMIAVSDGLNHVLWPKNFLEDQGYRGTGQGVSGQYVGYQTIPD